MDHERHSAEKQSSIVLCSVVPARSERLHLLELLNPVHRAFGRADEVELQEKKNLVVSITKVILLANKSL